MGVKIVTDSTAYLTKELRDKYDISIASLNVIFGNESKRESDMTNKEFYERIERENVIPTSSQPSTQELLDLFTNIIKKGHKVLAIFITSKMSGTFQAAHLVKNMVKEDYPDADIEILESNSNCMELGFAALEAAKAALDGKNFKEVISHAKDIINKGKFVFAPATLKYLEKGGRIGKASALLGSVLKIIPILTVQEGQVIVANKVRTSKKAINTIIDTFLKDIDKYGLGGAVVHHINCEEEAKKIANALKIKTGKDILIGSIGPVIGVHVGPGAVGIAYFTQEKIE
ncbi:DegV family protein [Clostridium sediminicola]|uniref:DegV family protein n=1 Tax=Clostridium sediminicola TaxID=3114879 RepID=UPI0031F21F92